MSPTDISTRASLSEDNLSPFLPSPFDKRFAFQLFAPTKCGHPFLCFISVHLPNWESFAGVDKLQFLKNWSPGFPQPMLTVFFYSSLLYWWQGWYCHRSWLYVGRMVQWEALWPCGEDMGSAIPLMGSGLYHWLTLWPLIISLMRVIFTTLSGSCEE